MSNPKKIAISMYTNDKYSQWLGVEILDVKEGYCKTQMTVRKEMTNGFKIAHGGISYGFADSTFAFASNSEGQVAVSIETSISHTQAIQVNDTLTAVAKVLNSSHKLAVYEVTVTNQNEEVVALFKGTVYRKSKNWESLLNEE
ncbi:hydroxyphenylacetyl-CoA thioesterase PaaI [Saprospiraceae bacterium]|nr:hydroxyphenylacetyl-CoA thioesterase PaaI [Saprospiraceae bacterium]